MSADSSTSGHRLPGLLAPLWISAALFLLIVLIALALHLRS